MVIIGEKINSTLKSVNRAIENYNSSYIRDLAKRQYEAGASYIDVNAGMFYDEEPERLEWLLKTIQEVLDVPFAIDSPNPKALDKALKANKNRKPIINSITDEKERYESVLPLILEYDTGVVALCMDDSGMPETVGDRVKIAGRLINKMSAKGVKLEDIYRVVAIETIRQVKAEFPGVHITCGLSNISFGIPARRLMNQTFLVAAMAAGMDGVILDPLDKKLMSSLYAAEALLGRDEFCMNYISKFREGALEF